MKTCKKCGIEKPLEEFWRNSAHADGKHPSCKQCGGEYQRQYKRDHPEVQRRARKKWEAANPEKRLAAKRRQWAARRDVEGERQKARRLADPEKYAEFQRRNHAARKANGKERAYRLMGNYGLTVAEYDALMAKQGERCPICARSLVDGRVKPVVDHCHDSGRVRGLLCNGCNMHLGWFEARQKAAMAYLKGC